MPYLTISPSEWVALLGAGGVFATAVIGAIAAAAVKVIQATHENTATVQANTADRATKTLQSNLQLAAIATTVQAPVTLPQEAVTPPTP